MTDLTLTVGSEPDRDELVADLPSGSRGLGRSLRGRHYKRHIQAPSRAARQQP